MSELAQELIQQALDQDFNKANKTFGDIMSVKIQDVLDQEKIKLADQMYNGVNPDDIDDEDDQLELDLEAESESESEEEDDEEDELSDEDEEDEVDPENDEE